MKWILALLFALMTTANSQACSMAWPSQDEFVLSALRSLSNDNDVFWARVESIEYIYAEGQEPLPPPQPQWSEDCPQAGPTTCVIAAALGPQPSGPRPIALILTWSVEEQIVGASAGAIEDNFLYYQLSLQCGIRIPTAGERWLVVREPGNDEATRRYFGDDAEIIAAALRRRD